MDSVANSNVMLVTQSSGESIGEKLRNIMNQTEQTQETDKEDTILTKRQKLRQKAHTEDVQSYKTRRKEISKILDEIRVKFEEEEVSDEDSD